MAQLSQSGIAPKSPETQGSSSAASPRPILSTNLIASLTAIRGHGTVSDDAWLHILPRIFRPEDGVAVYARDGMTLLHKACVYNLPQCAAFLLNHSDPGQLDDFGYPAILHAVIHAHWDCFDATLPRFDHGFRTPEGLSLASILLDQPDQLAKVVHHYDPAPLLAHLYGHYDRQAESRALLERQAYWIAEHAAVAAASHETSAASPSLRI